MSAFIPNPVTEPLRPLGKLVLDDGTEIAVLIDTADHQISAGGGDTIEIDAHGSWPDPHDNRTHNLDVTLRVPTWSKTGHAIMNILGRVTP